MEARQPAAGVVSNGVVDEGKLAACTRDVGEPPFLCGSVGDRHYSATKGEEGSGIGDMGEWGPFSGVPKALDWSLSRQARECLQVRRAGVVRSNSADGLCDAVWHDMM